MIKRFKVGLIRVVTLEDEQMINIHGRLLEKYYPELSVESRCIQDQPTGVHDEETLKIAVPKIVKLAGEWHGVNAIVVSCASDPAVKELRKELSIPVIGAGEATALMATRYGNTFGVLGITEKVPEAYISTFGDRIVGSCLPQGINSTLDLMTVEGRKHVLDKAMELKRLGAEAIALACTGMSTIGISKELEKMCRIPVIDPVMAEGMITYFECLKRAYYLN